MSIRLTFHGAARTVTGSCYLLDTGESRLLVDCGMFQGSKTERELNYRALPFEAQSIDALLLTHAHIDHAGLIPKLVKAGYRGRIYCTHPTVDLCTVMLPDSGFIQESEVRQLNERNRKRGIPEVEPIYTAEDAVKCLENFVGLAYDTWLEPAKGVRCRYWNAGHLLGSASIEVEVARTGQAPLRLLFSGDIGPDTKLFEKGPAAPQGFDFIVCESTYGGRDRFERSEEARRELLATEINAAAARKGALLIPSFAVERTQEVVTDLVWLMDQARVPRTNIFIDSPLAGKATAIFSKHSKSLRNGDDLYKAFHSPLVKSTESVDESKALARFAGFRIVVAASGMCDAGRIRHHLKNHLWQDSTTVLLVGYQAEGSLGRILEDGAPMVKIQGEEVKVRATIRRFEDYSGHADGPELVEWLKQRLPLKRTVFLTHGEEEGQLALERDITGVVATADRIVRPSLDDVYELSPEACVLLPAETRPRIDPTLVARMDWHNDLAELVLDINRDVGRAPDERARGIIIRRLRRALTADTPTDPTRRRTPVSGPSRRSRGYDEG